MRTPWRRRTLLAAVTVIVLGACGDDTGVGTGNAGGTGSTTSSVEETTTVAASTTSAAPTTVEATTTAPTTTLAPTTLAPTTAPPTTPAPTAPPTTPAPTTVPGPSALPGTTHLQHDPIGPTPLLFEVPSGQDFCTSFPHAGWVTVTCEAFLSDRPSYAVVQRAGDDGRHRIYVMRGTGAPDAFQEDYSAEEPGAGTWSQVTVVHGSFHFGEGPFNGDAEGLWVGYRYEGTGQYLDLDIIEWYEDGTSRTFALAGLDHGAIDARPGGADVLDVQYLPSDPGCCPSNARVRELTWSSNRWRIDTGEVVPIADAPAIVSDF